jgi:hypothetical protein
MGHSSRFNRNLGRASEGKSKLLKNIGSKDKRYGKEKRDGSN